MTRRPRPAHRPTKSPTPRHENVQQSKTRVTIQARPKAIDFLSESEGAEPARSANMARLQEAHKDDESDDQDTDADSESDDEEDIDAPRVAQWIDDEQFELQVHSDDGSPSPDSDGHDEDEDEDYSARKAGPSQRLRSLEDDLSTLPLGTLRNAQRSLAQAQALSDTETDSDEQFQGDDDAFPRPAKGKDKEKPDRPSKPKNDLTKRTNKHAPMQVTSKRPVSRRRVVVDDRLPKSRDPRFMHSAGQYDDSKFKQRYDFLSGLRKDELSTLREHVKRARKRVANSPSHLRAERDEEVNRLERTMKRAESTVNMDNRERVELEALQAARQTEKEKRNKGKAGWWMKQSEKKELLAKARLDAIAAVGGNQAVKKAVEKKQKKISQKEKKMRPFPRSEAIELPNGKRRRPVVGSADLKGTKRRKVA